MSESDVVLRVVVPENKYQIEELSPGVVFNQLHPGGIAGPNGETNNEIPGGQTWTEHILLGSPEQEFQMLIPDIRMPANQYWPLHWHDTWTVVLVLEGSCLIGDWNMQAGDIFITVPGLEYGPLLIGPTGCRLLEIFSKAHLANGGYSPEYRDHPTLQGTGAVFKERDALNQRNDGRQILSLKGEVPDIIKTRLTPGERWELGDADDMERGFMADTRLSPGERIQPHRYGDWHAILVLDGSINLQGKEIKKDGVLIIEPDSPVEEIVAGNSGAHFLELARTIQGAERIALT